MLKSYLEGSIVVSKFISTYSTSMTARLAAIAGSWYRSSVLCRMFESFAERKPTYSFSKSFKAANFLGRAADRPAGAMHRCISAVVDTSFTGKLFKVFAAEGKSNPGRVLAAALLSFAAGYFSVIAAKGLWSTRTLLFVLAPALAGLLLLAVGNRWKAWLAHSAVRNIYKYIIE